MKAKQPQFKEPHPREPLAKGEKPTYENESFQSPFGAWVSKWNDEVNREGKTREAAKGGKTIQQLDAEYKAAGKNLKPGDPNPATVEVSGDALARAKRGEPAKPTVDVKRGFN